MLTFIIYKCSEFPIFTPIINKYPEFPMSHHAQLSSQRVLEFDSRALDGRHQFDWGVCRDRRHDHRVPLGLGIRYCHTRLDRAENLPRDHPLL